MHDPSRSELDWLRLLPDSDFRLPMNIRPGDAAKFWAQSEDSALVLAERQRWLAEESDRYFLLLPEAAGPAAEATRWLARVTGRMFPAPLDAASGVEPDWVLLDGDAERGFPVTGGAVVFPSGWGLEEKIGHPLDAVHAPVPGLESALGPQIATFLGRNAPGAAWERVNWGLSTSPALNQHPSRDVRRLDESASLSGTWLRLEEQFLTRLPHTGAILFGIRVSSHRLNALLQTFPALGPRLERALRTMPGPLAEYKCLSRARAALLVHLDAARGYPLCRG